MAARACRQVMVAVVLLVLMTCGANASCPAVVDQLVYPHAALCGVEGAAKYYNNGNEVYELGVASLIGTIAGRLAPEWDETNSTFYVRSAEVGAKYAFAHQRTRELRWVVDESDDVVIFNSETGRALSWRKEGEDEWFLVEVDLSAPDFQFSRTPFSSMSRCNFVNPHVTCRGYHIVNFGTSLGLTPYWENGVTYFKLSNVSTSSTFPPTGFKTSIFQLLHTSSGSVSQAGVATA